MAVVALSNRNPYYASRTVDWTIMRDAYAGERHIKDKGEDYLPATTAMRNAGMGFNQPGLGDYLAYKARAIYHEMVKPAAQAMLGVMHRKDTDIELPTKLDDMRKQATFNGESLADLLVKINEAQMLLGRMGVMLDVKDGAKVNELPYIVTYNAEQMINWDSSKVDRNKGPRKLQFVVLDESGQERTAGLSWQQIMKYRVLAVAEETADVWDVKGQTGYVAAEVRNSQDASKADFFQPSFGGKTLETIPFVFIGPRDLVPEPDQPVLLPLARIALAIYRLEADYEQALYMQGQDVLVIIGKQADATGQQQVGAFGSIDVPLGGDAKYIGAESGGISDMRTALDAHFNRANQLGAQLLAERGNEAEAAGALNIRVASRTSTLTTMAKTACAGLEQILRAAAEWVDADPDKVHVEPNLDFVDDAATAQDLTYLMTGKTMGAPLSNKSIHGWLAKREFTTLTYEQEMAQKEEEGPDLLPGLVPGQRGAPGPTSGGGGVRPAGVPAPKAPVPGSAPKGTKVAASKAAAASK